MDTVLTSKKLLTLQEVADILRVNRSSISRLLKCGDLSYIAIGGRKLVEHNDLMLFIENRKVTNTDRNAGRDGA